MYKRIALIILDSAGLTAAPDAADFGDAGSGTLKHIYEATGLRLPNLESLGLGHLLGIGGPGPLKGSYGTLLPQSVGKDTIAGHWEMMGVMIEQPLPVYPQGFPEEILSQLTARTGYRFLGNKTASGTVIIKELGRQHAAEGRPILYTSADSVMQIAAHESVIPLADLYRICREARTVMTGRHAVGRIIARPFTGQWPDYTRTENRKDYALIPPAPTAMDILTEAGIPVYAVGKIEDVFAGRGITESVHTGNNKDGMEQVAAWLRGGFERGLLFANLNDFDSKYGHRRNVQGYADALRAFDDYLPEILSQIGEGDLLIITADHGNDPTYRGTDHTREITPLLVYDGSTALPLGQRVFADIGATVLANFGLRPGIGSPVAEVLQS